jgi:hypothetical protein
MRVALSADTAQHSVDEIQSNAKNRTIKENIPLFIHLPLIFFYDKEIPDKPLSLLFICVQIISQKFKLIEINQHFFHFKFSFINLA